MYEVKGCTSIPRVSRTCDMRPHMKRRQMQVTHNLKSIATKMTGVDYVPCRVLHPHLCVLCLHPRLSCSLSHLFQYLHVPSIVCRLFRYPHVPSTLCRLCPIFLHPHVSTIVCLLFFYSTYTKLMSNSVYSSPAISILATKLSLYKCHIPI